MYWAALIAGASLYTHLTSAHTASAQAAVLGPVELQVDAGESARKTVTVALGDALRMQGFTVSQFDEVKQARDKKPVDAQAACDDACADRVLRLVSVDVIALAKVGAGQGGQGMRVQIVLRDTAGHNFQGDALVREADLRDATARALLDARAYQLLGPGPWLRVEGTPENAEVLIDGSVVGRVPYRASIAAGRHELIVRDAGYSRFHKTLEVPARDDRKLDVRVALEPAPIEAPAAALGFDAATPETDASAQSPSRAWLAIPITMQVLGVGLSVITTVRLASGLDDCVEPDYGMRCTQRRTLNTWPVVGAYGLSAALIGSGIVWMVLGLNQHEEQREVVARFGIDHVTVTGRF